jgi:GT2 family glycosyltransferase
VPERKARPSVVIGIPVKNEAARIANCLHALSAQEDLENHRIAVVLLLNNCTDSTARIVRQLTSELPIKVHSFEVVLPPHEGNAGFARRMAMERASALVDPAGVLLTTDADGCVDPRWIARNLRALSNGADAVAGRIDIDPFEAALIPARLHEDDARECAYADLLDKLNDKFDPDPDDPLPRHSEHSGASIAVKAAVYRRVGGFPAIALGEDRAFFEALRRVDARIRHAPEVRVVVSGRTVGRATGGMADTIRRRLIKPDQTVDDRLEPAMDAARRAGMRRGVRLAWSSPGKCSKLFNYLATRLNVDSQKIVQILSSSHFGAAWAELERISIPFHKRKVPVADLENQTQLARAILNDKVQSIAPDFQTKSYPHVSRNELTEIQ